jgi:hypothetical protein
MGALNGSRNQSACEFQAGSGRAARLRDDGAEQHSAQQR